MAEGERFYDYYDEASRAGIAGTKWVIQRDRVMGRLHEWGVSAHGRATLDISGGPGFLTMELLRRGARRAVVTEFSEPSVEGMRRNLGVEAVKFDYASDRLVDVAPGPWDVVLVDASVNFCTDLRAFTRDLTAVLAPDGAAYVSWTQPTLGTMLRWQFDDYTYLALYPRPVMEEAFARAGLAPVASLDEPPYGWRTGLSASRRLATAPIAAWYRMRAPRGPAPFARALEQHDTVSLFRRVTPSG